MKKRFHGSFDGNLVQKFMYLKAWIAKVSDTEYYCKQCIPSNTKKPKTMFFEYFEGHIKSEKHSNSTSPKDLPLWIKAISYLNQKATLEAKDLAETDSDIETQRAKKVKIHKKLLPIENEPALKR